MTAIQKKEMKQIQSELTNVLLKKAGLTRQKIYDSALHLWTAQNLDLLTPAELKKYQSVIL